MIRILNRTIVYRRVHPSGNDGGDTLIARTYLHQEFLRNEPTASTVSTSITANNFKNYEWYEFYIEPLYTVGYTPAEMMVGTHLCWGLLYIMNLFGMSLLVQLVQFRQHQTISKITNDTIFKQNHCIPPNSPQWKWRWGQINCGEFFMLRIT